VRGRSFAAIVRYYRELHGASGKVVTTPYRLTTLGAWATSRAPHVFSFFKQMELDRYELFLDLGSGDGVVACIAGLFTRAVGIEVDPELCGMAQRAGQDLELTGRVGFVCGNYLHLPIWHADCLYLYPDKPMRDLEALLTAWPGSLLVYGPHFPLRSMAPIRRLACGRERMVLYRNVFQSL
jgi:hypothetical protein